MYIAPFHNLEYTVPENVKLWLEQLKEDIINDKINVPERYPKNIGNYTANNTGWYLDEYLFFNPSKKIESVKQNWKSLFYLSEKKK